VILRPLKPLPPLPAPTAAALAAAAVAPVVVCPGSCLCGWEVWGMQPSLYSLGNRSVGGPKGLRARGSEVLGSGYLSAGEGRSPERCPRNGRVARRKKGLPIGNGENKAQESGRTPSAGILPRIGVFGTSEKPDEVVRRRSAAVYSGFRRLGEVARR